MDDCGVKGLARSLDMTMERRCARLVAALAASVSLDPRRKSFSTLGLLLVGWVLLPIPSVTAQDALTKAFADTSTAYASAMQSSSATSANTRSSQELLSKVLASREAAGASGDLRFAEPTPNQPAPSEPVPNEPSLSLRDALFEELAHDAERFQRQYGIVKRVVRLVSPTIVHIDAYSETSSNEAGSGIIIKLNDVFYVLTNRHVVDTPLLEGIKIKTDEGELLQPVKKWADSATDVAVIQVASKDLLPTRVGDSDKVEIGDFVLAVGSPFGLSHSVSYGIISAKGRWDLAIGEANEEAVRFQDFLQTDAAINPGNSGGPLLNLRGEVVGINTAIASNSGGNEGIGFSIPINLAINVAKQLVQSGAVSTAYLGVRLDHDFDEKLNHNRTLARQLGLSRARGAFVKSVTKGSPADQARLQAGDIVVEFNGVRVEDDDHLINLVSLTPLNEVVSLNIVRARREYFVHVRVGKRRDFEPAN